MTAIDSDVKPDINYALLTVLAAKPHKHLNLSGGGEYLLRIDGELNDCSGGIGEVMEEARTVQHLCDLAGVPEGRGYAAHIDARVFLLMAEVFALREQVARIAAWHSRESGEGGTVGDFCTECGTRSPCDTQQMADGTYVDPEDAS